MATQPTKHITLYTKAGIKVEVSESYKEQLLKNGYTLKPKKELKQTKKENTNE